MEKKKIILIGPPSTGKTTIKLAFFDNADPVKLFKNSLKPTRGINSDIYTFFDYTLGIFDLAGQESENWLTLDKEVFTDSSAIIVVFDVHNSLESMLQFLVKIMRIKKEILSANTPIYILIHKIDLLSQKYIDLKINKILDFFKMQFSEEMNYIKIFKTSIVEQYYYESFFHILEILLTIINKTKVLISNSEFEALKIDLSFILKLDTQLEHDKIKVCPNFHLSEDQMEYHLQRLQKLGFITLRKEGALKFRFTKRAELFKVGIIKEKETLNALLDLRNFELLHSFLNFEKISIDV